MWINSSSNQCVPMTCSKWYLITLWLHSPLVCSDITQPANDSMFPHRGRRGHISTNFKTHRSALGKYYPPASRASCRHKSIFRPDKSELFECRKCEKCGRCMYTHDPVYTTHASSQKKLHNNENNGAEPSSRQVQIPSYFRYSSLHPTSGAVNWSLMKMSGDLFFKPEQLCTVRCTAR